MVTCGGCHTSYKCPQCITLTMAPMAKKNINIINSNIIPWNDMYWLLARNWVNCLHMNDANTLTQHTAHTTRKQVLLTHPAQQKKIAKITGVLVHSLSPTLSIPCLIVGTQDKLCAVQSVQWFCNMNVSVQRARAGCSYRLQQGCAAPYSENDKKTKATINKIKTNKYLH